MGLVTLWIRMSNKLALMPVHQAFQHFRKCHAAETLDPTSDAAKFHIEGANYLSFPFLSHFENLYEPYYEKYCKLSNISG